MPRSSSDCGDAVTGTSDCIGAERPPFRAPTQQKFVHFRKQIEAGNYELIKRMIWDNPRFLISSGDTPTSLKEGYRYNAMHICAQWNQAVVAELLLKTISDREFIQLYAGKKIDAEMCAALNKNLLDYYLNMPDKGRGETPLHFAVKYGHLATVEVLVSYPQCKSLKNTDGMYPKDIICQRAHYIETDVYKKLELLLSEPHYVPVFRAVHNEVPPHIGLPFTPNEPPSMQFKTCERDNFKVDLRISALAGPMPREQAFNFFRRWKTPPRIGSNVTSPLIRSPFISPIKAPTMSSKKSTGRRVLFGPSTPNKLRSEPQDSEKLDINYKIAPVENNNNDAVIEGLRPSKNIPLTPLFKMRPDLFFDCPSSNLSSNANESPERGSDFSFNVSDLHLNDSFRERHIKNSDIEKGLEVVGRQLAQQAQLEWREYWDFLDTFVDIASSNGLSRLENYLSSQWEKSQSANLTEDSNPVWNLSQMQNYLDLISDRSITTTDPVNDDIIPQVMTPYTCVEKSLQVFAKRITKTFIHNINSILSINDSLLSELKRLKSLIASFKDDARFLTVDFTKVHSRMARLMAVCFANSIEVSASLRYQLMQILQKLLELNGDRREDLHCVCASMLGILKHEPESQLPDAFTTEELCSIAWQKETGCICVWDTPLSRKTSRRKRSESLRAHIQDIECVGTSKTNPVTSKATAFNTLRTADTNRSSDDIDSNDELFFFECGGSDRCEDEEIFLTPPENLSPQLLSSREPPYELYIYGKVPTKRDLDVFNAIFHVQIEKVALPYVYAWRTAMESFSAAEMDLFPSPKSVQIKNKTSSVFDNGSTPKTSFGTPKPNPILTTTKWI